MKDDTTRGIVAGLADVMRSAMMSASPELRSNLDGRPATFLPTLTFEQLAEVAVDHVLATCRRSAFAEVIASLQPAVAGADPHNPADCPCCRAASSMVDVMELTAKATIPATLAGVVPADPDRACSHPDFQADVDIMRLTRSVDDPTITGYSAEVKVHCLNCGEPFRWRGAPAGYNPRHPTCSVDETVLIAPIRPASADPDFGLGIPGYAINLRKDPNHE